MKFSYKGFVKELWQIYLVEFFSSFYFAKAIVILFFLTKGLSLAQIGLSTSIIYGMNLIFEYPSGIFADKYGRKLSMQISNIGAIIASVIYALGPNFYYVILASAFWGASWSFYSGSKESLTYDSLYKIKKEKLNKEVVGFMDTLGFIGMIIATLVGQFLYQINNLYPFLASAIIYSVGTIIFATYKEPKQHESAETLNVKKAFNEGVSLIFKNKTLLYIFIFSFTIFFFEHAWYEANQVLLVDSGLPQSWLSPYFVISSILGLIGGIILPKIVHSLKTIKSILLVIILQGTALLFISSANVWLLVPFSYFLLISHQLWNYVDADIIHKHIPSRIRATAMSGRQLMLSVIFLFNPWLMAFLVQTYKWTVFVYSGILVIIIGVLILKLGKKYLK